MSVLVDEVLSLGDVLPTVQPAGISDNDSVFDLSWDLVSAPAGMAGTIDIATTSAVVHAASIPDTRLTCLTVAPRHGKGHG